MDKQIRIKEDFSYTVTVEKSVFICYLRRCKSEAEAKNFIAEIRKKHYDATHVCTAYFIDENTQKANDDGEPKGTAGIPMLETLKKMHIQELCACVVRYFKGIKLGAGGLIRAYSSSVSEAVNCALKVRLVPYNVYKIIIPYAFINKIEYFLNKNAKIIDKHYEADVSYFFISDNENIIKELQELTGGKFIPEFIEHKLIEIDI